MTCTDPHPHRPDLRHRADRLLAALDSLPAPQTLPDIIRTARALMIIDRLLGQLWTIPPVKSGRQRVTAAPEAPTAAPLPDDAPGTATPATPMLNRHQRRLQAVRDRNARPDGDPLPRRETG